MCLMVFLAGCKGGEKGETEYAEMAGVYTSKISMSETQSVDLYLKISDDGSFVFARDTEFASNEKGAGKLSKTEDGADAFFYTELNGEALEEAQKVATYELNADGAIQFTSPMWFGSTEPKIIGDDESVSYPIFEKYDTALNQETETTEIAEQVNAEQTSAEAASGDATDEAKTTSTTKAANTSASAATTQQKTANNQTTAKTATTTKTTTTKKTQTATTTTTTKAAFQEGTYKGSLTKYVDAMSTNITYDVTVTFSGGKYNYSVKISAMGQSFDENYSGTYTVNGNSMTMTGKLSSGTISGSSIKIKGVLSSFAGNSEDTITVSR
ncbi:MAG: hypothetical protein K2G22_04500 [Eubacterium sp.]|nr:hypothetical protein [Eubacterium sp.]